MKSVNESIHPTEALYQRLTTEGFPGHRIKFDDLGDDMQVLDDAIGDYWKHRFLLDHRAKRAYEFMNHFCILQTVTADDIEWDKMKKLPEDALDRAHRLSATYPTIIRGFRDNVGLVEWQLNPDGYYFMDEDGFGMTNDKEIPLYGCIDRAGRVLVKFHPGACNERSMRQEAQKVLRNRERKM
jgi:hypothetical protein